MNSWNSLQITQSRKVRLFSRNKIIIFHLTHVWYSNEGLECLFTSLKRARGIGYLKITSFYQGTIILWDWINYIVSSLINEQVEILDGYIFDWRAIELMMRDWLEMVIWRYLFICSRIINCLRTIYYMAYSLHSKGMQNGLPCI